MRYSFNYIYKVGGISFYIKSSKKIKCLTKPKFAKFANNIIRKNKIEISFYICGNTQKPIINSMKMNELLNRFKQPPYLGRGTLIFPPLKLCNNNKIPLGFQHNPLINNEYFQNEILECLNYPENIYIFLHDFAISILDFKKNELHIYYQSQYNKMLTSTQFEISLLRIFSFFLINFNSIMLHSSSIIINKIAYLFIAPDEGGKTTVVKLLSQGKILNDDQNILKKTENNFNVFGTPFGKIANNEKNRKLGGIFFLQKSTHVEVKRISKLDAVKILWNQMSFNTIILPKHSRIKQFDVFWEICQKVPIFYLYFNKNHLKWQEVKFHISNIR